MLYSCAGGGSDYAFAQTTPVVVSATVSCATSVDGSVVGVQNPLNPPVVAAAFSGTLPAGNYYTQIGWYDAAGHVTLVSPEVQTQLTATGALQVNLPTSGKPAAAVGMNVYIGASSGAETLQGQTAGAATFTQSTALTASAAVPATNTTICAVVANDAGWPTGTGYTVSMVTPAGNVMPGYPMQWQLLGPGTTQNLGQGLPLYNGTVTYPIPILARPYNHAAQSISGPLNMTGYAITQVLKLGVGTSVPAWSIDVENGQINTNKGYIFNGGEGVTTGECLMAGSDPFFTFIPTDSVCLTVATAKYQTVENNGTALPQEPNLNLVRGLTGADDPGNNSTDIGLPNTVTAGVYAQPLSMTLSAQGVVTAITPGGSTTPINATCTTASCYQVQSDGTIREWGTISDSTFSCSGNARCTVPVTFPHPFTSTTNLVIGCTMSGLNEASDISNFICGVEGAPTTTAVTLDPAALQYIGGIGSTMNGDETLMWTAVGH